MKDTNVCVVSGNLVRDAELRYTADGTPIATFSVAVNGIKDDDVSFIDVDCWKKLAEIVGQYCKKGTFVIVSGRLKQETWTSKEGNKRSKIKIVAQDIRFFGKKQDGQFNGSN